MLDKLAGFTAIYTRDGIAIAAYHQGIVLLQQAALAKKLTVLHGQLIEFEKAFINNLAQQEDFVEACFNYEIIHLSRLIIRGTIDFADFLTNLTIY